MSDAEQRHGMNQNNQMWDAILANELHMGKLARRMNHESEPK